MGGLVRSPEPGGAVAFAGLVQRLHSPLHLPVEGGQLPRLTPQKMQNAGLAYGRQPPWKMSCLRTSQGPTQKNSRVRWMIQTQLHPGRGTAQNAGQAEAVGLGLGLIDCLRQWRLGAGWRKAPVEMQGVHAGRRTRNGPRNSGFIHACRALCRAKIGHIDCAPVPAPGETHYHQNKDLPNQKEKRESVCVIFGWEIETKRNVQRFKFLCFCGPPEYEAASRASSRCQGPGLGGT